MHTNPVVVRRLLEAHEQARHTRAPRSAAAPRSMFAEAQVLSGSVLPLCCREGKGVMKTSKKRELSGFEEKNTAHSLVRSEGRATVLVGEVTRPSFFRCGRDDLV